MIPTDYEPLIVSILLLSSLVIREVFKRWARRDAESQELEFVGAHTELAAPLAKVIFGLSERLDDTVRSLNETRIKLDECLAKNEQQMRDMASRLTAVENKPVNAPKTGKVAPVKRKTGKHRDNEFKRLYSDKKLSMAEIARRTGWSYGTVRRVLNSA